MVLKSKRSLILIIICLLPLSGYSWDVDFPLLQSFTWFPYVKNTMLQAGEDDLVVDLGYSNVYMFNYERDVVNDFDFASAAVAYRRSVSRNLTVELYLRTGLIYGGVMDKLIENFHGLIGNGEDGRGEFPRNTLNFTYKDVFSYDRAIAFAGPFVAGVLTRLYEGDYWSVNFRASLGIPLQEKAGISSGKPFLSSGIIFLYRKNNLAVDMSLYGSFFKIPGWGDAGSTGSRMFFLNVRGAYKRIFGGLLFRSSPFREGDLSNPAWQIYAGFRISRHLSISMYEEIPPMDTVTDVSFRLTVEF